MSNALRFFKPYLVALALIAIGAGFRLVFLSDLGRGLAYLTFYPTVMGAAIIGGLSAGLFSTLLSALLCFYWIQHGQMSYVETFAFGVFLFSSILISVVAETMRRAQLKAHMAQQQAEAANKAKSVFLSNMSHELRTPLNAVLGFSSLLRDQPGVTKEQISYLNIISRSGEHLLNLINNILDISKIESGHIELEEKETELLQLIDEIKSLMFVKAIEKRLDFSIELSDELPEFIMADAGKLRQVLINLIGNAIKFTQKGSINLRVSRSNDLSSVAHMLRFEVSDTGPGIAEENLQRIFTAFVQLENQYSREPGTGLGLAISKQNVKLMQGEIGVKSELNKGSVFYFEIPVKTLSTKPTSTHHHMGQLAAIAEGQTDYRILIVEDQPENKLLLLKLIQPMGFQLRSAMNGKEAVEQCEQWHPDLIFMDMRMPVMNGIEATRIIRSNEMLSKSKIVAVTAHALEQERNLILEAGCDDFIRKPYSEIEIYNAITKHLGVRLRFSEMAIKPAKPDTTLLTADDLAKLPPQLIKELQRGAELLDDQLCNMAISKVDAIDKQLTDKLRTMVKNMQYQELLTIFEPTIDPQQE
ncbi:MAG: response regulator [Bacteroidetes bacterium]|nr:response regulator [Bacteroidota bacterium]